MDNRRRLIFIILLCPFITIAQDLLPYLDGDLYGFSDENGHIIIQPQFNSVTNFGDARVFDNITEHRTDREIPEFLAEVRIGDRWNLINTHGEILLRKGTEERVKISPVSVGYKYQPNNYLISGTCEDGWGYINVSNQSSTGLLYLPDFRYDQNQYGAFAYCPESIKRIPDCNCFMTRREDLNIDLVQKDGTVILSNIPYPEKDEEKLMELKQKCLMTPNQAFIPKPEPKKKKKPRGLSREQVEAERKGKNDLFSKFIGKKIDEVRRFVISYHESWHACINRKRKKLYIVNKQGKLVKTIKTDEFPSSIQRNRLLGSNAIYLKGLKKNTLLTIEGKVIKLGHEYADVIAFREVNVAFLNPDDYYPFHVYDKNWKRILDDEVIGNKLGIIKSFDEGNTPCYRETVNLIPLENIAGIDYFDDIGYYVRRTRDSGDTMKRYDYEHIQPAIPNIKGGVHSYFLEHFHSPRKRKKKGFPQRTTVYQKDNRLIVTDSNLVVLDTIVDKFLSIDSCKLATKVIIKGDTVELPMQPTYHSFNKYLFPNTKIYQARVGDNYELRNINHDLLKSVAVGIQTENPLNLKVLNTSKYLLDRDSVLSIIDTNGDIQLEVPVPQYNKNKNRIKHMSWSKPNLYSVIDHKFLKVHEKQPYLINLDTYKILKE